MLSQQELDLTKKLHEVILNAISASGGSIPLSQYIQLALFHDDYGYYNNHLPKFGVAGDFITAPLVSPGFAYAISQQILELFDQIGSYVILEVGAGNGQFMLDTLSVIGEEVDNYYIVEVSKELAKLQFERLTNQFPHLSDKVTWLTKLPENFSGVVFANELFDCQPCESYIFDGEELKQVEVSWQNNNFTYLNKPFKPTAELLNTLYQLPALVRQAGYTININQASGRLLATLANRLTCGAIILIDYGYGENEFYSFKHMHGTLRGFFRHTKVDNILEFPGLIDITSSVNFTAIAKSALANGLELIDYTHQAGFLLNCDILDYLQNKQLSRYEHYKLSNQINQLTNINGMGEVFKVIGLSKNMDFCDWLGFRNFSQAHLL
jgi:SAM-dependent MidA family methyltransferase